MTEPSQYFKGRTVQEQMNEVIGYVDVRAEEVAAAKADDVLEPAEQAKDDAIAAKEAAEQARDTTLAALPTIQQDITDLKAEDIALDGRLDTVELKVQTAEGNIVTIQGQIVALQTADGQNVKINAINDYALGLSGNQNFSGTKEGNTDQSGIFIRTNGERDAPIAIKAMNINITDIERGVTTTARTRGFGWRDSNGNSLVEVYLQYRNGSPALYARAYDASGVIHTDKKLLDL